MPAGKPVSVLRDNAIEPVDAGALAAVVSACTVGVSPSGAEWAAAEKAGALVVRPVVAQTESDSPAWLPRHVAAWEAHAEAVATEAVRRGVTPIVWAVAGPGQVVSDAPGLATFLRSRAGSGWKFLADPAGLLAPSMMERAEEHLGRMAATLKDHPALAAVVVRDVEAELGALLEKVWGGARCVVEVGGSDGVAE